MKALLYTRFGPPEVLQLMEVEKPIPKEDEVLVRVHAASVNPFDGYHVAGKPFMVRYSAGLFSPKHTIPGADIAGKVESVGAHVTQFRPGDEVFGDISFGGFGEYVCAHEKMLTLRPSQVTAEQAASIPIVGVTALQSLRDHGKIKAGHQILINGASGGVGTFAVQIAKHYKAIVTGVCSTGNIELVRSIGADRVLDYTQQGVQKNQAVFDLIIDTVGNLSISDYKRLLAPQGICVVVGFPKLIHIFKVLLKGTWVSKTSKKKIGLMSAKTDRMDLDFLKELVSSSEVKPVIDRSYPQGDTAEAFRYIGTRHARGKIIVTL